MGCLTSKPQRKRYRQIEGKETMANESADEVPSGHQTFDGADMMDWVHTSFTGMFG